MVQAINLRQSIVEPWSKNGTTAGFNLVYAPGAADSLAYQAHGTNVGDTKVSDASSITIPPLSIKINVPRRDTYYIWVKSYVRDASQDSIWVKTPKWDFGGQWNNMGLGISDYGYQWKWTRIAQRGMEPGIHSIDLCPREPGGLFEQILVTNNPDYIPSNTDGYQAYQVFEVESGTVASYTAGTVTAMYEPVNDPGASKGQALRAVTRPDKFETPTTSMTPVWSHNLYADQGAAYEVWIRAMINDSAQDSMWVAVDNEAYVNRGLNCNTTSEAGQWKWTKIGTYTLTQGNHTLKFIPRETAGIYDQVIVSRIPGYIPNDSMINNMYIADIHSGYLQSRQINDITTDFIAQQGEGAAGGSYLKAFNVPARVIDTVPADAEPVLSFSIDVHEVNDYNIYLRGVADSASHDSVWIAVDDRLYEAGYLEINDQAEYGQFKWARVKTIALDVGMHTIKIIPRELNVILDQIAVVLKSHVKDTFVMNGTAELEIENTTLTPYAAAGTSVSYNIVNNEKAYGGKAV